MPQAPVIKRRRVGERPTPAKRSGSGTSWDEAVWAYLQDCRARNCSVSTITGYRGYLTGPRLKTFVDDYRIRTLKDVTPEKLRAFQAELLDAGVSPGTAHTFHKVMRSFFAFCEREGYGIAPEALTMPAPRLPVVEPETFSELEEKKLLDACRNERDRMIIQFMIRTGLRRSEVVNVTIDDIIDSGDGAFVRVRQGKGRKDRIVPLDTKRDQFSKRLARFIRTERPRDAKSSNLWLSLRSDPGTGDYPPMNGEGLKSTLDRIGDAAGVRVYPHKFRHTFASRALAAGIDSLVLQRALGHTTLAMVNRYVHFQTNDLLRAWKKRED